MDNDEKKRLEDENGSELTNEDELELEETIYEEPQTDLELTEKEVKRFSRNPFQKFWMVLSFVLLISLVYVLVMNPFNSSEAIAKINGENITKDQLYDLLVKNSGDYAMDQLILETLIDQQLKKANLTVNSTEVDEEIEMIVKSFPSEEQFYQTLAQQGLTMDSFKEQMQIQVKINKVLAPGIEISEESIKDYFEQNKAQFDKPEQVSAAHILVSTMEEAEAILAQLKDGADFAQLAEENSLDPGSKDMGGELGFFPRGYMDPAFEAAAFATKDGELSDIVESEMGFHIIKVGEHQSEVLANYEENKADIEHQLFSSEVGSKFGAWYEQLKEDSDIKNYLNDNEI